MDPKKVEALVNMLVPTTPHEIQVFNGMAQFYRCFIRNFVSIISLISKLFKTFEVLEWTKECQNTQEEIKNWYIQALILINPNWELEFHVHIDAFQLAIGAILAQNPISKFDQLVIYAFGLLNSTKKNYTTTERETLAMVYALHKFRHSLLGNQFVFYFDHMAIVY